jgi:hypothetical protein
MPGIYSTSRTGLSGTGSYIGKTFQAENHPSILVLCTGGSHEGYCKWACVATVRRGWRAVVLNLRGCNGLPLTSPRGYSATLSHDIRIAVAAVHRCVGHTQAQVAGKRHVSSVLVVQHRLRAGSRCHQLMWLQLLADHLAAGRDTVAQCSAPPACGDAMACRSS